MPSNPTAHLVHLVHLLMATNQRMRSSFKILVALYRIFHTLFSSFFSGSSMAHHIYCSSLALLRRFCFFLFIRRLVRGGVSGRSWVFGTTTW
jgi:hypothetical protein